MQRTRTNAMQSNKELAKLLSESIYSLCTTGYVDKKLRGQVDYRYIKYDSILAILKKLKFTSDLDLSFSNTGNEWNSAMATSPNPNQTLTTPKKKDESFLDKLGGTLGRKKKAKEVNELTEEGRNAIESPTSPTVPDVGPEGYLLDENEERSMIDPQSRDDPKVRDLMKILLDWINDVLADDRIIVKDIEEDLFDGQILQKLIEKLAGIRVEVPEVTQSEQGQKQKLQVILSVINRILQLPPTWSQSKWSVDSVHSKNLVAILHLLVTLARHFRAPVRLPDNVSVNLVVVQKRDGMLLPRRVAEEITTVNEDIGARFEVTDLEQQFHDGVYLVLLMGLLEGYFVPLYDFHLTPTTFDQKMELHTVHNVSFAFELMQDSGLAKPKARPEDVVNQDLKSTLRVLYNIFTKYKDIIYLFRDIIYVFEALDYLNYQTEIQYKFTVELCKGSSEVSRMTYTEINVKFNNLVRKTTNFQCLLYFFNMIYSLFLLTTLLFKNKNKIINFGSVWTGGKLTKELLVSCKQSLKFFVYWNSDKW
ncbi:hypothetical protein KUTeg_007591 [Tegillarca granosa]|uniref:Calponin-homology (CH) domain-containing protein n=1 Tax=Tegillarca granosa TaxID=220873 RepID=A0ABQ9FDS3_TEGGR|nr:hypothetical protein KUTeg_007591 [Tegillarca granosa]